MAPKQERKPKITAGVTAAQMAEIMSLYKSGKSQTDIAAVTGLSNICIKKVVLNQIARRSSRKLCGLTEDQDEQLLDYLQMQEAYQGSYRVLRGMMELFAGENDIKCDFSEAWRRSFHKRHQDALPVVIRTLFGLRLDQYDTEVVTESDDAPAELTEMETIGGVPEDQLPPPLSEHSISTSLSPAPPPPPTEPRHALVQYQHHLEEVPTSELTVPVQEDVHSAVQQALTFYTKAGVSEVRARALLRNMRVPGFEHVPSKRADSAAKRKKNRKSPAAPAAAPLQESTSSPAQVKASHPAKKSPLQLRVLEREFLKSAQMTAARAAEIGHKLALDADQVTAWFRNKRHKRPATASSKR